MGINATRGWGALSHLLHTIETADSDLFHQIEGSVAEAATAQAEKLGITSTAETNQAVTTTRDALEEALKTRSLHQLGEIAKKNPSIGYIEALRSILRGFFGTNTWTETPTLEEAGWRNLDELVEGTYDADGFAGKLAPTAAEAAEFDSNERPIAQEMGGQILAIRTSVAARNLESLRQLATDPPATNTREALVRILNCFFKEHETSDEKEFWAAIDEIVQETYETDEVISPDSPRAEELAKINPSNPLAEYYTTAGETILELRQAATARDLNRIKVLAAQPQLPYCGSLQGIIDLCFGEEQPTSLEEQPQS
ncbi:hypothetical protein HOG48_05400 [Candidatus Peregrinibacteria bacterium]|jgi:hypothetical protein|nr:hypothetical protein [Candidatus Peregrinibacteria bacterium]